MYICWFLKIAKWFFFSMIFNNVCRQRLFEYFLRKTTILIKFERIFCKNVEMIENVFDFFNNFISWSNDFLKKSIMIQFFRFLKRFRNIQSIFFFCFEFKYWTKVFDVKANVCFNVFVVVVVKCLKTWRIKTSNRIFLQNRKQMTSNVLISWFFNAIENFEMFVNRVF